MKTIKGEWLKCNLFVDEFNNSIKVTPYNYIWTQYKQSLPLMCYVNIDEDNVIYAVMEV